MRRSRGIIILTELPSTARTARLTAAGLKCARHILSLPGRGTDMDNCCRESCGTSVGGNVNESIALFIVEHRIREEGSLFALMRKCYETTDDRTLRSSTIVSSRCTMTRTRLRCCILPGQCHTSSSTLAVLVERHLITRGT
jgi:hypothetical protein